jgi:hypothetical protein
MSEENLEELKSIISPEEYLQDKSIFIATPCYGGSCGEPFLRSMVELSAFLAKANIKFVFSSLANESLITRARNKLVKEFLKSDATHLFFIDADIRFNYTDVIKLVLHDKDVAVGAYPLKALNMENLIGKTYDSVEQIRSAACRYVTNFVFSSEEAAEKGEVEVVDGLIEVHDAGTGFMCIKREVIENIIEQYQDIVYLAERDMEITWAVFDTFIDENRRYLSEDYAFCRRWQAIGGKIWLDPEVKLDHFGTIVYTGTQFILEESND